MKEQSYCSKCGAKCTGKMQVQGKDLRIKILCTHCFVEQEMAESLKIAKRRSKGNEKRKI